MKELGIAITLVSFILLSGCKDKTEPERQVVAVEKVGVDNVEIYGEYVGQIRAKGFVEVRARVEGYLEQMLFEEGKRVKRNQPLFKINSDLYQARVDKAKAQLAKDQAAVDASTEDKMRKMVEQRTQGTVEFKTEVNPDLIGGFILEYDTYRMDASVKTKLNNILTQLKK